MDSHVHSAATLTVVDLYIIEVSSKAGILFGLDDNTIGASSIDCNRAPVAGENERWTCTDCECPCWHGNAVSQGPTDTETKAEKRSNESCSCTEEQDDDECDQTA